MRKKKPIVKTIEVPFYTPGWQGMGSHPVENKDVLFQLIHTEGKMPLETILGYFQISWLNDDPEDGRSVGKFHDAADDYLVEDEHISRWMYIPE